jgi:S-DNA-T family DNA segregation ATPase FtsK/SpoIIIE
MITTRLADLAEVTRHDSGPVRLADLPPRLRKLAPSWGPYRSLTGVQLRELLDAEDIRVTNTANVPRVDPADLRVVAGMREAS